MAMLVLAILLLPAAFGLGLMQHTRAERDLHETLTRAAREQAGRLASYFERARSIILLTAHNPAFAGFYEEPGERSAKVRAGGPTIFEANRALEYLEDLYPGSIGEACFIDRIGAENARVVRGEWASPEDLSLTEDQAPFFHPAFSLDVGQVYQAQPYVSPDTLEWVVANATIVPVPDGSKRAIVHFEVTVESFRREAATLGDEVRILVVDRNDGTVIIDSARPQEIGEPLGVPSDRRFQGFSAAQAVGSVELEGREVVFQRVAGRVGNANDWYVIAEPVAVPSLLGSVGPAPFAMALVSLVLLAFGATGFRSSQRDLTRAATVDSVTGLGNRLKFMTELRRWTSSAHPERPFTLALFDLNGFKTYNDSFGHPAGDALLARLGGRLGDAMAGVGTAYRMGGDEFCVLTAVGPERAPHVIDDCLEALSERGEGFHVTASVGVVVVPEEATAPSDALRIADKRMYFQKNARRASAERQSSDVLLQALRARFPDLEDHLQRVGILVDDVARHMGMGGPEIAIVRQAAQLHDVGKVGIPDAILLRSGPLDPAEWEFMKRHSAIGERILEAAPALAPVARLVRHHHERFDGTGYPAGLHGHDIPLGARIISVCDAYDAMVAGRPYRPAISHEEAVAELRRCSGSQFDPEVVQRFVAMMTAEPAMAHFARPSVT